MRDEAGGGNLAGAWAHFCGRVSSALEVGNDTHPLIYGGILEDSDWRKPYYWICLLSSCGIATLGLAQNSPAVIIGAMLLSPLMSPIVGLGLALALGDLFLGMRSLVNCLISTVAVVGLAALITLVLPFKETTAEILARTRPNPLDLFIALFCGFVAAVSVAKSYRSGPGTALPGAAIAVALVPPLCVAGWGLGAGFKGAIFRGAMVLFLTNLTAIVLLSLLVFLAMGIGNPGGATAIRGVLDRVEKGGRLAEWVRSHPWAERFRRVGGVRSRILLVAVSVAVLYIPLNSGLKQVKRELLVNREVRSAIPEYLGKYTILSRKVTTAEEGTRVHLTLVSESTSPAQAIAEMETYLKGRLGGQVAIDFTEVARGVYPQGPPPSDVPTPGQNLQQVISLVRSERVSGLAALWPEGTGYHLVGLSLVVPSGSEPPAIRVHYIAGEEIPPAALEAFRLSAQRSLGISPLALEGVYIQRVWGELNITQKKGPTMLKSWVDEVGARAVALPVGVGLDVSLHYPEKASATEVAHYTAVASSALESLSAQPWVARAPLPPTPVPIPSSETKSCTLIIEAKQVGSHASR